MILSPATLAKAGTDPPQTRRLGFAEGVAASFELETHEGSSTGPSNIYQKAVTRSLQGLSKLTGSGGELPGVGTAPWGAYEVGVHLRRLGDATDQILAAREAGVPGAESIQTLDEVQAEALAEVNRLRSRAEGASGLSSLVGGLGAGISDPAMVLTLPFGASAGARTLTAVLSEAGINVGLELAIQEPVQKVLRENGIEPSATAVERALMAGVGAAGFTAVGRGLVGLLNRAVERGAMRNRSALAAAADDVIDMVTETERNPLRDAGPHGERAHLEALGQAGADASAGRVPFTERITLRSQLAREYADLAREIGGDAPRAVEPLARPGSGRGLMRHALDTLRARGIEADLVRGTEIDTLRFRVGDGERVVEVPRDANAFEARAAIDAGTVRSAQERVPLTKREAAAEAFVEPIENLKRDRTQRAKLVADRTVDGVIVNQTPEGMRPFKSKQGALSYARNNLPGEWEAVRVGKGFAAAPANRQARELVQDVGDFALVPREPAVSVETRRMLNEVNDTPVDYDDIVAAQVAQERAAVARRAAETEDIPPVAPDEDPFAGFDPDSLPEDLTVAMREVDASGREVVRNSSAREVVNRLQAFEEYLRCRLG